VERNLLKINTKSLTVFEKKLKKMENFFYKLKKLKKKAKEKIIFVKFTPKRSAPKWIRNKMGNAKKGHNKTGPCQSGCTKKTCFPLVLSMGKVLNKIVPTFELLD